MCLIKLNLKVLTPTILQEIYLPSHIPLCLHADWESLCVVTEIYGLWRHTLLLVSAVAPQQGYASRQQCQALHSHRLCRHFQGASMNVMRHQRPALSHHELINSGQDETCSHLSSSHKNFSSGSLLCWGTMEGMGMPVANYVSQERTYFLWF